MSKLGRGFDDEASPDGASLSAALRWSLLRAVNAGLRARAGPIAARSLRQIRDAVRGDRLDVAMRTVDRAWRCQPDAAAIFAPIYGRLLSLDSRDYNAALHLLRQAAELSPDPDVAALLTVGLMRLQRPEDACRQFAIALEEYCIWRDGLLARVGGELLRHSTLDIPGWLGRGYNLELVGELASGEASNALEITLDGGASFTQLLPNMERDGLRTFSFAAPQRDLGIRLDVSARNRRLLGSGLLTRTDFSLDGRLAHHGRRVSGWARIGWAPTRPLHLRIEDENGHRGETRTRHSSQPSWRWPFEFDLSAARLMGGRICASVQLPDGRWQALPDAPLLMAAAMRLKGKALPRLGTWRSGASRIRPWPHGTLRASATDVIIPVYGNRDQSLACIGAVLATMDDTTRLVVVDDASVDPALHAALDELRAGGRIELLRNTLNQGFVASANRALALHPTRDAVLLNSDTLVFDDWLARLRAAAYGARNVGTVTPLSNNGSIASYPCTSGGAMGREAAATMHAMAAATLGGMSVEIPVGVGFCLYMRRDCLRDVGDLDATVFGTGYGEETDFCLRARRRGWSHRLATDVFVYHAGGISFGQRRKALLDRSRRLINLRHPGYDRFIDSFVAQDPLRTTRRKLDEIRLSAFEGRFVLLVTLALAGGVDRFVTERGRALNARGVSPLVLRPSAAGSAKRCELWTDALEVPNLTFDVPTDLSRLITVLKGLRLEKIEIQHFMHVDARVIDAVRALQIPHDIFVHDYSWICPRVTLIDGTGRYCGEPSVSVCEVCVRRNGSNLGEAITVAALRARSATWLHGARRVMVPSFDAATRLKRHFNGLDVEVLPHAKLLPRSSAVHTPQRKLIRVALIGAIGTHKGYRILLACARDAGARKLPIEFVVIGHSENDAALLATHKVFITGHYSEAEAPHLIHREQPDIAWLPSVAPETWCYTLDYALSAGLPVAAFDLGAIAERLRALGLGELLPLDAAPRRINDRLLEIGKNSRDSTQTLMSCSRDDATMLENERGEMRMTTSSNGKPLQKPKDEGLSASVQVLPLPPGLYLFSVTAASPLSSTGGAQLTLPAMHVGLGPGVRSDQVEFIAGPSTHGAWLFSAADLLVTKVNGAGATLILTSVRAPAGEVLSIKVERLDDRSNTVAATASAAISKSPVVAAGQIGTVPGKEPRKSVFSAAVGDLPLPVQIGAHIRTRGDMSFANVPWAGRVAPGLWIESFSVRPLERFGAADVEYKGLTGSGFETPWLSDGNMCGTKGMATPLVGFAIRLKPSPAAAAFDCEYSGYFQSGMTIGPLRNGAPCRSSVANDSLEGIQVRLVKRVSPTLLEAARKAAPLPAPASESKPAATTRAGAKRTAAKQTTTTRAAVKKSSAGGRRAMSGRTRPTRRQPTSRP